MEDEIVRRWFKARFRKDPEVDVAYSEEWAERFLRGLDRAICHMDGESRGVFLQVIKEFMLEYGGYSHEV